jgi:phosphatidylserine/phosphatidylglycerophosphate/cardiolipin synthase-like enzyme
MADSKSYSDHFTVNVSSTRKLIKWVQKVIATTNWYATGKNAYPPRPGNVLIPLTNGETTFTSIYTALYDAKISIDILVWDFDPSTRLMRPDGERLGDLLIRKSSLGVKVRILEWSSWFSNDASRKKDSGGTKYKGVDKKEKAYRKKWLKDIGDYKNLRFLRRGFTTLQRGARNIDQLPIYKYKSPVLTTATSLAPSHHQKTILVDYESPKDAIGFVMGFNLQPQYWDTDEHEFDPPVRKGFKPWQDLACRIYGPILYDINSNFSKAWIGKGDEWFTWHKLPDSAESKKRIPEDFYEPAKKHGKTYMAQICRTEFEQNDNSIKMAYSNAILNARKYIYFENQYFRYEQLVDEIKKMRVDLKKAGIKSKLHVFVVINIPGPDGANRTRSMLAKMGKQALMPGWMSHETDKSLIERTYTPTSLEGVHIHICSLKTCTSTNETDSKGSEIFKYRDIYIHSKLLLVDDIYFNVGSANVNTRGMETDSELNVASPAAPLTKAWREFLWTMHTGSAPKKTINKDYMFWKNLKEKNSMKILLKKPLEGHLIQFFTRGVNWAMGLD